jgi:Fe-Mn family superoxide dismutase
MRLHTLLEANVEPKSLDLLDKWIHEMGDDLEDSNPSINHGAFLTRLRKDIINNNRIFGANVTITALQPYKPKKTDPDYIKNATEEVYTVNPKALEFLYNDLLDLFIPDEGEPTAHAMFNKFHELVKSPDTLDANIANKLLPLKKKYEQGKFDLPGLKQAMQVMTQLGAQKWKYDKVERQRIKRDAPIIMKFSNGYMWVRLDSKAEMEREGEMMQNCISGYCPVGQEEALDSTFGLKNEFAAEYEPYEQTDDAVYEWLEQWVEENGSIQDYIEDKLDRVDPWEDEIYGPVHIRGATQVEDMSDEEALDWMAHQIMDADADIETGESPGGHLVYSLRDKHGESHISAEYDPQMDMNYPEPTEALGKQNKQALDKYKPYIEKLNDFFGEFPETFGHDGATIDEPRHPNYYGTDLSEQNESIINRMKPSVRQTILEAKSAQYLYHATFTKNVPNIINKGLLQFQPSLWIKGPGGSRYNEEAGIFAFDNPKDALNWAGKMEWEFRDDDKDISIVRIDMEEFWGDDPAEDPFIAQHGRSMRSAQNIKADKIIDAIKLDDLGKPGDLGISRDEWLDQSSKVLGEGLWDDIKNKVRIYNPEFKVGWDSKGDPTANLVWHGKFDKNFSRYDTGDWVNPNPKKSAWVDPDKLARDGTAGKLTKTSTGYRMTEATKEKLTLAKLPYAKNALAPVMGKKTLDYHYSGLAKAYVDKFNSGEGDAKFNEAGAFLHNIFFPQLQAPTSGNKPSGVSLDLINNKYGSFDKFKEEFTNTAMGIQGSGWIYLTKSGTIKIIKNHAIRTDIAMLVDWWEHAWVLDYEKDKGKYCANFWRIINWDVVNEKLGQTIQEGKLPKGHRNYKKQMAAIHAEDVEYDHQENTYPEIEFVCANDEFCDATDPEAQNALWNSLRSVEGIVSYKQDWSHDDPVGNPVSMAVIIKDPTALSKVKALADEHGVEIDLDSIERRNEKYLDTLASGETPYVVDVMFHEENNMKIKDIKETIQGNYKGMGYQKNKNDKFALIDHTFEKVILTTNDFEEAKKEAVEWAEYDDIHVSVVDRSFGLPGSTVFELDGAADAEQWRSDNDEWDEVEEDVNTFANDLRSRLNRIKKVGEDAAGVGKVVKGVNTTADVKKGETKRQAAKFGNKFPPSKYK